MQVLVVGGTGVLSGAFVKEALCSNMRITMINRGRRLSSLPEGVTLIKADKDNFELIKKSLEEKKYDCVIDFLCSSQEQLKKSFLFYSQFATQYVFISSCAVFDKRVKGLKDENAAKPLPVWDYSVDKWQSEELLKQLAKQKGCPYTIVRPCVTYDNTRIPYGIAPRYRYHWTFIARAQKGKPIITWNNGENRTNMMRVEDFAVGLVGIVGNVSAYNQDYNVCGDEMPSYADVIRCISDYLGYSVPTIDIKSEFYAEMVKSKKGEILGGRSMDATNDNSKIKKNVPKFKQTIYLKEGVKKTLDAYRDNNYYLGIDYSFDGECDYVIKKWCKKNNLDPAAYNLGFVDYFGNASVQDRKKYLEAYCQDSFRVRFLDTWRKMVNRINSHL